ncbi:phosphatase 2C-like domain-containing protein [Mycena rosella]|uniref:Phosphatase 2C-like domain-containing protein n=1 Tax=Mycena rosella TaxID=1033263 RepID=A0AAD7DK25_MYCRO|nr:phosphatase 2C-like domain-containing protein [Mycena rosella]
MDSITATVETISEDSFPVARIHRAELQSKNEDRTVVHHFERGTIIAIFDGHCGSDLAIFAADTLPPVIAERLCNCVDVEAVLKETLEEFDQFLLSSVLELFDEDEDWSDDKWLDLAEHVYPIIGYNYEYESFRLGRRAALGCTALIVFLDQSRTNLWVASLGDSDAVCVHRSEDGKFPPLFLSERHNCSNPAELARMRDEHPDEDHAIMNDAAVLGCLRVTRSLGDHQLKVPLFMASRIMPYFYPSLLAPSDFKELTSYTPPYMSSTPAIRHHAVAPGDLFLLASDGLRDMLTVADDEKFPILIALAKGEPDARLGHECVAAQDGDNISMRIIENVLFGTDLEKKAQQLNHTADRDDISLVVLCIE